MKNSIRKYHETAQPSRRGTWMTAIVRIFTDPRASASSAQSVFYRRFYAFICGHLRLNCVSLSDRTRKIKFELFPIQEKIESANNDQIHSCLILSKNNQQNNHFFAPFASFAVKNRRLSIILCFENHRDLRGHREKRQPSTFSVYSVVDCLCNNQTRKFIPNIFIDIKKVKLGVNLS
jgi:hypothetical protein